MDPRSPSPAARARNPWPGWRSRARGSGREGARKARLCDAQGGRGDFYVVVRYALPDTLSDRQRQLLAELGKLGGQVSGGARR